jgi:hypothetical protein
MKATALKTTLGSGAFALALIGGAALVSAPASANPNQSYWGGSVSSGAPGTYQQVRRRVYVPPAYAYDPGYDRPAYDGPPSPTARPSPTITTTGPLMTTITAPAPA